MPISAPGSRGWRAGRTRRHRGDWRGFTLIELLIVVAIVAIASAVAALALRDPDASALEREADRLSALFEAARAESRASGLALQWVPAAEPGANPGAQPRGDDDNGRDFRFLGLPQTLRLPQHWLTPGVQAEVIGARTLVLGPEPLIGAQRIVLSLGERQLALATDGLSPFAVQTTPAP